MASKFSLLDILQENMNRANRKFYIHRIIYIGDHTFTAEYPTILEAFENSVNVANGRFTLEPMTGLFLYYARYYVHMMEGPEEVMMRHLKLIYKNNKYKDKFGRGKVLVAYHNINQRFFTKWGARNATPPTLLNKVDPQANMEESSRQIKICLQKVYKLCNFLKKQATQPIHGGMGHLTEKAAEFLPEFALLDFLLNSKYLMDLNEYLSQYKFITEIVSYEEIIWPAPAEYIPHDVFDVKQDVIEDLIKEQSE